MANIKIVLHKDKHHQLTIPNKYKIIAGENNATVIGVEFPIEVKDFSKRVDFLNEKGVKWTLALFTPEYEEYKEGFDTLNFKFTLPDKITLDGEIYLQFIAYNSKEHVLSPFDVVILTVEKGILYAKKKATDNPDLIVKSYEHSMWAVDTVIENINYMKAVEAEIITALSEETQRATTAENSLQTAIETETMRATTAENEIAANLGAENERAKAAEKEITANLDAEIARAKAAEETEKNRAETAESNLQTTIATETTRAKNSENSLQITIQTETARATTAENEIAANLGAENERANAAEKEIMTNLDVEIARAKAAEEAEKTRAETAEASLLSAITAETARATNAECVLTSNINTETVRAKAAEDNLQTAINAERDRSQTAEGNLQSAITAEEARAKLAEQTNASAIVTEKNRATATEAELASSIAAETLRAKTAEQANAQAITAEETRAKQAETNLGARLDKEVPDALAEAKAYADQVAEQVRIDGTIYRGTVKESELPTDGEQGDLYWISEFDITDPEHSGSAIFNATTQQWDFNIDRYKHQDNDTIVARESDGALKVADINETALTADTTDYGTTVNTGFKATIRGIIRKIRGLFQRTAANETAISTETTRATTAEGKLGTDITAEVTRAKAAEQTNATAISAETARATAAEQAISQNLTNEIQRATQAEQANANAIASETQRSQTAEGNLQSAITAEETARKAGDNANAQAISNEVTRATTAEAGKVDKMTGKGLSTEDYTTAEKNKLAGIAANANNYSHPATHPPSIIAQDASNRFMTDAERTKLAGIAENANNYSHPASHAPSIITQDANNRFMTDTERTKLAGIEESANNYSHPATHPPSVIAQDANNRFMTDAERTKLAGLSQGVTNHASSATTYGLGSNSEYGHTKLSMPAITAGATSATTMLGSTFGQYARAVTHMGTQSSIDLNNFTSEGDFMFYTVTTRTNFPSNMDGINTANPTFRLEVRNLGYTATVNIHQTLYARAVTGSTTFNDKWTRQCNSGTWTEWERAVREGNGGGNNYTHPATHPPSIIAQDASNRFTSDSEKSRWNSFSRASSIVIAPSNASDKSKLSADIVLTGDSTDATNINTAINGLANGGEVRVLEGSVKCYSAINLKNKITISGQGHGTTFQKYHSGNTFSVSSAEYATVQNFTIDSNNYGGVNISFATAHNSTIENIAVINATNGFSITSSNYVAILNSRIKTTSGTCVNLSACQYLTMDNCHCQTDTGTCLGFGGSECLYCAISNTSFIGKNVYIVYFHKYSYSIMTGCYMKCTEGVYTVAMLDCHYTLIASNTILCPNNTSYQVAMVNGSNNLCIGNRGKFLTSSETNTTTLNNI